MELFSPLKFFEVCMNIKSKKHNTGGVSTVYKRNTPMITVPCLLKKTYTDPILLPFLFIVIKNN